MSSIVLSDWHPGHALEVSADKSWQKSGHERVERSRLDSYQMGKYGLRISQSTSNEMLTENAAGTDAGDDEQRSHHGRQTSLAIRVSISMIRKPTCICISADNTVTFIAQAETETVVHERRVARDSSYISIDLGLKPGVETRIWSSDPETCPD